MTWRRLLVYAVLGAVPLSAAAGCGKKGPPLPPLRIVPAAVEELGVRRLGQTVYVTLRTPDRNTDGSSPADLEAVEVYALTGDPVTPEGQPFGERDFRRYGALVGRVDVRPPPEEPDETDPATGAAPAPSEPPDPRPGQGVVVEFAEPLDGAAFQPFVHPDAERVAAVAEIPVPRALAWPPPYVPPTRVYVAVGLSTRGLRGPLSVARRVPMVAAPAPPPAPRLAYDERSVLVTWTPPGPAPVPPPAVQPDAPDPARPGPLAPRPLFPPPPREKYNVYEVADASAAPRPLNAAPLDGDRFVDSRMAFGVERCYEMRTVAQYAELMLESAPSPPACVTPVDTFAPAAPQNLAAVGGVGAVDLIWEPNIEPDLAGYLVVRGEPGGDLTPLMSTPIRGTTYRDVSAVPGTRYVYAVVAVDGATPPNVSAPSNRVEESAR